VVCGLNYDESPVLFNGKLWIRKAEKRKRLFLRLAFHTRQHSCIDIQRLISTRQRISSLLKVLRSFFFSFFFFFKDRPLPSHLWVFVFPTGVQLEDHSLPPRFFVNALTYSDGTRSFVICFKFFEKTPWPVKKASGSRGVRIASMNVKKGVEFL
jgi:hypothetical protein